MCKMNTPDKAMVQLLSSRKEHIKNSKIVISSLSVMSGSGHLCVGSSDNSVSIYELMPQVDGVHGV